MQTTYESFERAMTDLSATALRVKGERDEALALLRESLLYSAAGEQGSFKTRVRDFLARVSST